MRCNNDLFFSCAMGNPGSIRCFRLLNRKIFCNYFFLSLISLFFWGGDVVCVDPDICLCFVVYSLFVGYL